MLFCGSVTDTVGPTRSTTTATLAPPAFPARSVAATVKVTSLFGSFTSSASATALNVKEQLSPGVKLVRAMPSALTPPPATDNVAAGLAPSTVHAPSAAAETTMFRR